MNRRILSVLTLLLVPSGLCAQEETEAPAAQMEPNASTPATDATSALEKLEAKRQELAQVGQDISAIADQARQNENVQESIQEFRDVLTREMIRAAPEVEPQIKRQNQLVEELATNPTGATSDSAQGGETQQERQQKREELSGLREQLGPIEQQVQDVAAVQEARAAYEETLMAEMQKIDSRTGDLIQRYRQLSSEINRMQTRS